MKIGVPPEKRMLQTKKTPGRASSRSGQKARRKSAAKAPASGNQRQAGAGAELRGGAVIEEGLTPIVLARVVGVALNGARRVGSAIEGQRVAGKPPVVPEDE